jgi:hypothetical protein
LGAWVHKAAKPKQLYLPVISPVCSGKGDQGGPTKNGEDVAEVGRYRHLDIFNCIDEPAIASSSAPVKIKIKTRMK